MSNSKYKTDNHPKSFKAKVEIRQNVLAELEAPIAVFDAFAGSGQLHGEVWFKADRYVGCDLKWLRDEREMFVADNRRVMRSIDLGEFNCFDLDAYGSPWEQAIILSARRKVDRGERIAVVLTEGLGLTYKLNHVSHAIRQLTGFQPGALGLGRDHNAVLDRAISGLAHRMNCAIHRRWQADGKDRGRSRIGMRYVGLILQGK